MRRMYRGWRNGGRRVGSRDDGQEGKMIARNFLIFFSSQHFALEHDFGHMACF